MQELGRKFYKNEDILRKVRRWFGDNLITIWRWFDQLTKKKRKKKKKTNKTKTRKRTKWTKKAKRPQKIRKAPENTEQDDWEEDGGEEWVDLKQHGHCLHSWIVIRGASGIVFWENLGIWTNRLDPPRWSKYSSLPNKNYSWSSPDLHSC